MKKNVLIGENKLYDFSLDIEILYSKQIKEYPLLSHEEIIALLEEYKKGNLQARGKIIEGNLRLVSSIASHYAHKTESFSDMDLIQEGTIGLMRAIELYDPNKARFSTYATRWIKESIRYGILSRDKMIRTKSCSRGISKKYNELIDEYYQEYGRMPTDQYIQKKLRVDNHTLYYLKNQENYHLLSLNQKIKESENTELGDIIESGNDFCDEIINNKDTFDLLNVIRSVLTEDEYYILYSRVLSETQKTQETIGNEFGVTNEAIRQREKRILKKITPFVNKDGNTYKIKLSELKKMYGSLYDKLKQEPLFPETIYIFLYVKDRFSSLERRILYLILIDKFYYTLEDIKKIVGISIEEIKTIYNHIEKVIQEELKDRTSFQHFKEKGIEEFGTTIYKLELVDQEKKYFKAFK